MNKILDEPKWRTSTKLSRTCTRRSRNKTKPTDKSRWEKATSIMEGIVQRYLDVESVFESKSMDAVMATLIKGKTGSIESGLGQVRAHSKLKERSKLVLNLLSASANFAAKSHREEDRFRGRTTTRQSRIRS